MMGGDESWRAIVRLVAISLIEFEQGAATCLLPNGRRVSEWRQLPVTRFRLTLKRHAEIPPWPPRHREAFDSLHSQVEILTELFTDARAVIPGTVDPRATYAVPIAFVSSAISCLRMSSRLVLRRK